MRPLAGERDLALTLAGQAPRVVMEAAHRAILFCEWQTADGRAAVAVRCAAGAAVVLQAWVEPQRRSVAPCTRLPAQPFLTCRRLVRRPSTHPATDNGQQALYAQYAQEQGTRRIVRTQEQCRKKLQARSGRSWGLQWPTNPGAATAAQHACWCTLFPGIAPQVWNPPCVLLQEVHAGYLAAKRKYQAGHGLEGGCSRADRAELHVWMPPAPPRGALLSRPPALPLPLRRSCGLQEVLAQKHALAEDNRELQVRTAVAELH